MYKLMIILFLLVSNFLTTHADQKAFSPKDQSGFESSDFKPHMLDHINKGCPSNSYCSKKSGHLMNGWNTALQEAKKLGIRRLSNNVKEFGLPFDLWAKGKSLEQADIISWDSSCPNHNIPQKEIYSAIVFTNDISKLSKKENLFVSPLLVLKEKKVEKHPVPRDASPMFYNKGTIHYLMGNQGDYYGMKISQQGKISVNKIQSISQYPQNESCHPKLLESWKKLSLPENLFKNINCSKIWDSHASKYIPIIYGWTCHI